jgi:hypothetical protein
MMITYAIWDGNSIPIVEENEEAAKRIAGAFPAESPVAIYRKVWERDETNHEDHETAGDF